MRGKKSSPKQTDKVRASARSKQAKGNGRKKTAGLRALVSRVRAINRSRRVFDSTPREIEQGLASSRPSRALTKQVKRLDNYPATSDVKKYDDRFPEDYTVPRDPELRRVYDELAGIVDP